MDPSEPTSLAFDDVVIDLAGHRLLRGGVAQPLEPKAFGVLALLAQAPGRVFPRDEILDTVWGHRHVTPGVLNRVMTLLRHALGEDAHTPRYLHTLHGVGYRFDLPAVAVLAKPTAPAAGDALGNDEPDREPRRRATDVEAAHTPTRIEGPRLVALLVLLVLAATGYVYVRREAARPEATAVATRVPASVRSIAVLPLVNASNDKGQQAFSDGLSDALIASLARFEGLKVIGRTSTFRFRDSSEDSMAIGRALGASYLLGGSVEQLEGMVRIRASLVRADDGVALWADHYDRPYKDRFALQDEIAHAVASALQARLLPAGHAARLGDRPPNGSIDAYNAYLLGLQAFYDGDMRKAVAHQAAAVRLDPGYATAWAQMSVAWTLLGQAEQDRTQAGVAFRHSRAAAERALELAPELGLAHAAMGNLLLGADFAWAQALARFRRAAELAPEYGPIHGGLSRALAANGKLGEALEERYRFLSIEPLFAFNYQAFADLLLAAGQLDEAEKNLRIGERLKPPQWPSHLHQHLALVRGDHSAALELAGKLAPAWRTFNLAMAAQIGPDRGHADATLAAAMRDEQLTGGNPYAVAQLYALRGDAERTVYWLERAWEAREVSLHHLLYDPFILRLRDDPRLVSFCSRKGLPPPGQSEALSLEQIRAKLRSMR